MKVLILSSPSDNYAYIRCGCRASAELENKENIPTIKLLSSFDIQHNDRLQKRFHCCLLILLHRFVPSDLYLSQASISWTKDGEKIKLNSNQKFMYTYSIKFLGCCYLYLTKVIFVYVFILLFIHVLFIYRRRNDSNLGEAQKKFQTMVGGWHQWGEFSIFLTLALIKEIFLHHSFICL